MLYVERENSGHLPNGEQEGDTSEIMETSIMEGEEYYNQEGGEWTQKVDTGQLCRVCANPNDYLIPIFDGEGLEHELSMKIQKHLPIKVTETDTLPQHMCYQCASTLIAWHDLVISCVEADKKLRELQMEENDDDDDKGGEMFESPSLDSEMTDDVIQPSTSETQNQNQVSKTPSSKKAAVAKEKKSKLKMILVKGPPAGTSGQKTASKTQVAKALELAKSKDGVSQDSASERCQQSSLTTFREFQQAQNALKSMYEPMVTISTVSETVDWIKSEDCNSDETQAAKTDEQHHSDEIYHCDICDKKIRGTKFSLEMHIKSHKQAKKMQTSVEHESDSSEIGFESAQDSPSNHSSSSNGRKKRTRTRLKKLKIVKLTKRSSNKSIKKDFPCDICGRIFNRTYHLNRHKRTHRPQSDAPPKDEPIFQCELCGKNFSCKSTLKSHQVVHTGEKPFTCHICGKSFSQTGLYYHLKHVHAGIKNHSCDICGRSFAAKPAMEDHRRIHTGERPYVCSTCGKSFKTKATLYIHNKIHTDIFPFACSYCGKLFRNQHEMVKHLVTHTGEKPHMCDICGRGFRARNEMTRHRMLHSDDKPFVCSACGLGFKQERYLKRHMKAHHPGNQ
ncbi:zinc finger protein 260-like isoform X18 [Periplaneta americana]|uniref:zinc finger protein 260-like isoform X18 n=1 Tax=Periplaneta americana TaxID=6978 RepID=UPI0037E76329